MKFGQVWNHLNRRGFYVLKRGVNQERLWEVTAEHSRRGVRVVIFAEKPARMTTCTCGTSAIRKVSVTIEIKGVRRALAPNAITVRTVSHLCQVQNAIDMIAAGAYTI